MDNLDIPQGFLHCIGDNHRHSTDSRDNRIGWIDPKLVVGEVMVC